MQKSSFPPLLGDSIFLLGYAISYLLVMALLRACLLYVNINLAGQVDNLILFNSFLVGLRFDLIIACILVAPLVLTLLLPG